MAENPSFNMLSSQSSSQLKRPASSHRLPTVSASQALQNLQDGSLRFVGTGLESFDRLLSGDPTSRDGGFERGKVTEIWGPSGAGKTATALQGAMNALNTGRAAVWVDVVECLAIGRLRSIVASSALSLNSSDEALDKFHHVMVESLPRLLALILHPLEGIMPHEASLLVIDGIDSVINQDYPRYQNSATAKPELQRWQSGRRYAVLGSIVSALNKLAILRKMAVVVTTGCSTRTRSDSGLGPALVPGIGGVEWDAGISDRLVVFQDYGGRFIGVQKCQGKSLVDREVTGDPGKLMRFSIDANQRLREEQVGMGAEPVITTKPKQRQSPVKALKRSFDEVADSEDEDVDEYGWIEEDGDALASVEIVE